MNKQIFLTVLLMFFIVPCLSIGAQRPESAKAEQLYHFDFKPLHGDSYSFETQSRDHDEAFKKAAEACFNHFKQGRHVSMDEGQDIIDICVNPKKF